MATSKIYVGDIGTAIILKTGTDISTATAVSISALKPDLSEVEWDAALYEINGVESALRHIIVSGDLDQAGVYKIQGNITTPDYTLKTNTISFTVYEEFA